MTSRTASTRCSSNATMKSQTKHQPPGQYQSHLPVSSLTFSVLLISRRSRVLSPLFWVPDIFTKNRKDVFLAFCRTSDCGFGHFHRGSLSLDQRLCYHTTTQSGSYFHYPLQCGLRLHRRDVPSINSWITAALPEVGRFDRTRLFSADKGVS